ncbi:MAG TPA: hypothetical protein VN455_05870 [Methanotrichaceae archaeon]|nr:hypothetical protein [Methanotrichaceae archaeon]
MRLLISLAVILLAISASCANAALDYPTAQKYVDNYNSNVEAAPAALKELLGSERVELDVAMTNGSTFQVGFEINNAKIVKMYPGGIQSPTIDIGITEDAMNTIGSSNDKVTAFQSAMSSGQVTITSDNLFTKIKLGVVLSSMSVLKFFNGVL